MLTALGGSGSLPITEPEPDAARKKCALVKILSCMITYMFKATFITVRELVSKRDFLRDATLIEPCVYTVKSYEHPGIARDRFGGSFRKCLFRLNRKDGRNMWESGMDIGLSNSLS